MISMNGVREVKKIITGSRAVDGAGVRLIRVFGHDDVKDFDPFLMLDAFDSVDPDDYKKGFPWHPHRGIETVTYLLQGSIEHGDSLGNKGTIMSGDCQWMTAGSGIIHQEMPQISPHMLGVQLWLNLPARDKMTQPKYRGIQRQTIPVVQESNAKIHVISGQYRDTLGAMQGDYVKANYFDVELSSDAEWNLETDPQHNLFVYIISGSGRFGLNTEKIIVPEKSAVLFEYGEKFRVKAANGGIRFLLLSGKPLKEPVAWGGSIVMNTQEELAQAFVELSQNTFIK